MSRDTAMLSVLYVVVLAVVAARFSAAVGYMPCQHRCPWCFEKLQEAK